MNSKISLIVPVFNEEDEIENFFNELNNCNFNLINEIILLMIVLLINLTLILKTQLTNLNKNHLILIF